MDTGQFKNNTMFYEGFEGETEITLSMLDKNIYNIHIYEGYFSDIFGSPSLDGNGWNGFTRDCNQFERSFGNEDYIIDDVFEYYSDILIYKEQKYEYQETYECYQLLCEFLKYALDNGHKILVHVF